MRAHFDAGHIQSNSTIWERIYPLLLVGRSRANVPSCFSKALLLLTEKVAVLRCNRFLKGRLELCLGYLNLTDKMAHGLRRLHKGTCCGHRRHACPYALFFQFGNQA